MKITPGFIPVPFLRHHCCVFSPLFLFSHLPDLSVLSVLSIIFYRRVCCGFWLTLNFPELTFASVCSQSRNSPASSHLFWRDFLKQQKALVEHSTDANVGVAIIRFYCQLTIISRPDVGCELKKARCTPHETTLSHIFNKIFSFFLKLWAKHVWPQSAGVFFIFFFGFIILKKSKSTPRHLQLFISCPISVQSSISERCEDISFQSERRCSVCARLEIINECKVSWRIDELHVCFCTGVYVCVLCTQRVHACMGQ